MKLFLDANIILDFCIEDRPFSLQAKELFQGVFLKKYTIGTSEDILTTVFYIGAKRGLRNEIIQFFRVFEKIGTIECFGASVRNNAFDFCEQHKNTDLEDVLQAFCAKENGYDMLISSDKNFVKDIISVSFSGDNLPV